MGRWFWLVLVGSGWYLMIFYLLVIMFSITLHKLLCNTT